MLLSNLSKAAAASQALTNKCLLRVPDMCGVSAFGVNSSVTALRYPGALKNPFDLSAGLGNKNLTSKRGKTFQQELGCEIQLSAGAG